MSPPHDPTPYRITDLSVAAFLLTRGHPLIGVEREGTRITFLFNVAEREVLKFFADDTLVPARKLLDALKNLKGITKGGGR